MDEYPASPASPRPRGPRLSVVIPVHNGGRDFERCLQGLRDSDPTESELVVVDDGSADQTAALAKAAGAKVIRHPTKLGPAAARNAGALAATAPLIFFLDADVVIHPDAIGRALRRFDADPSLAGLFGSYDADPADPGLVSRFRNLLHHYVHQAGTFVDDIRPARTFWTGCGLIRRDVFLDAGGFDPQLYRRPAIEDIELGYRVTRLGHRIVLARDVQATHLKRWSLLEMIRTDIFRRGVPWMLLMKRSKIVETDLNVSRSQRACVALTGLGLVAAIASPWFPALLAMLPMVPLAVLGLNFEFYRFLIRRRGPAFAVASTLLHLVYYCCCGTSVVIAQALWLTSGSPDPAASPAPSGRRLDRGGSALATAPPHPSTPRRRSRTR